MAAKKWFFRGDFIEQKSKNVKEINNALDYLVKHGCLQMRKFKGDNGVVEKFYTQTKIDAETKFLHSTTLQADIHNYVKDYIANEEGNYVARNIIMIKFCDKNICRETSIKLIEYDSMLENRLVFFPTPSKDVPNGFDQHRMYSPKNNIETFFNLSKMKFTWQKLQHPDYME